MVWMMKKKKKNSTTKDPEDQAGLQGCVSECVNVTVLFERSTNHLLFIQLSLPAALENNM